MKRCPPSVGKCGGNWIQRQLLRFGNGDGNIEPSLGYGLLYNWYAATDARGVAPSGFRVASNSDYNSLSTQLGGGLLAGGAMKSERLLSDGDPYWSSPNTGATNESGFTAFPAGIRNGANGVYQSINDRFEAHSQDDTTNTTIWSIQNNSTQLGGQSFFPAKGRGMSIRCVSDTEPSTTLVQDNDGNNYSWVQIGSQYWLQQSLKTTTFNNGDKIPTGLDNTAWANTTDPAWAYPNGDSNLPI
jgi:uncharacterized protein (TIGR02145 family)